jgi:hypothetical protein
MVVISVLFQKKDTILICHSGIICCAICNQGWLEIYFHRIKIKNKNFLASFSSVSTSIDVDVLRFYMD